MFAVKRIKLKKCFYNQNLSALRKEQFSKNFKNEKQVTIPPTNKEG